MAFPPVIEPVEIPAPVQGVSTVVAALRTFRGLDELDRRTHR